MSRRANGEGSIYQRKDGRWAASISVGKGKRKHFLGKTRADVASQLTESLKAQQDGLPVRLERQTLSIYMDRWLADVRPALKARTWTRYEELVRLHARPVLGKRQLPALTPQQVQGLHADLQAEGLSAGTVRQLHAVLHKALGQALKWGLVVRNVTDAVTPPKAKREEMKTLSPVQARQMLEAAADDRLEALFVLAITTGMRQGELLGLRWHDIDFEHDSIRVQRSLQRTKEGFVLTEPKTGKSRRQVLLTEAGKAALRRQRVTQAAERLVAGGAWEDKDLVFTNPVGAPLEGSHVLRQSFYPMLKRAGLPKIRFHDLRHTAATLLLGQGIHPKIVSEMLGHSNIYITLDLYSHVTPTMQRLAADTMDALLRS